MNKKRLSINFIASIFQFLATLIIGFYFMPFIIKSVSKEVYGFFAITGNMSTCHKIIRFTHAEMDSSLPYIRNYPLGLIVKEDDEHVDYNAQVIPDFIVSNIGQVDPSFVEKAFIKNTPEYFVNRNLAL